MVCLGLTYQWCHTCQSAGDCSFPSAFAASWSSLLVGCPQSTDACSPGKTWRGLYIPGCRLRQGNLRKTGYKIKHQTNVNNLPEYCGIMHVLLLPPKNRWPPMVTRNGGLVWAKAPSSPLKVTDKCPRLESSSTECHWPSFRSEPGVTNTVYLTKEKGLWGDLCHTAVRGLAKNVSIPCVSLNVEWTLMKCKWAEIWGQEKKKISSWRFDVRPTYVELQWHSARLVDLKMEPCLAQVQPDCTTLLWEFKGQQQPRLIPRPKLKPHWYTHWWWFCHPWQAKEALGAGEGHGNKNGFSTWKGYIPLR